MEIDIIIPCHNSHKTIDRTLGSILCQRVLASCKITLVRDGGEHYNDIIERYSPVMNIQEIGYDDNGGPGKARNYGIKNTKGNFIVFIDSDDCLSNPFSIINMVNEMYSEPGIVICIADFFEEVQPMVFKRHHEDTTFVHGKMYRRSYLEKNNILFNEKETSNEDVGFNILSLLLMGEKDKVKYTNYLAHYWLCNPNSIVRKNKEIFDSSESFRTFVKNMGYIYEELEKRGLHNNDNILQERVASMGRISNLYFEKTNNHPEFKEENLRVVKDFYKNVYKPYEKYITEELFDVTYDNYPYKEQFQLPKEELKQFINSLGE